MRARRVPHSSMIGDDVDGSQTSTSVRLLSIRVMVARPNKNKLTVRISPSGIHQSIDDNMAPRYGGGRATLGHGLDREVSQLPMLMGTSSIAPLGCRSYGDHWDNTSSRTCYRFTKSFGNWQMNRRNTMISNEHGSL